MLGEKSLIRTNLNLCAAFSLSNSADGVSIFLVLGILSRFATVSTLYPLHFKYL